MPLLLSLYYTMDQDWPTVTQHDEMILRSARLIVHYLHKQKQIGTTHRTKFDSYFKL